MACSRDSLQIRLARFEFEALFCEDLGWHRAEESTLADFPGSNTNSEALDVSLVATTGQGHGVLLVRGTVRQVDHPQAFHHWLGQFPQLCRDPLIIWIEPRGQRSLWCWTGQSGDVPYWRTLCLIKGQGNRALANRLWSLREEVLPADGALGDRLNPFAAGLGCDGDTIRTGFLQSWQALNQGMTAIPDQGQREHYAMVLLCRLVATAALQRRGYLGEDDWYLHNQFGQSQQRGQDQFFQKVFQPLCQQGLTLPPEDRPLPVQKSLGALPFVPNGPFSPTPLDPQWGHLPIVDAAFEPALTWLGDWLMAADPLNLLLELAEAFINGREGASLTTAEPILHTLGDCTLNATVLDRASDLFGRSFGSIDGLMLAIAPAEASQLLEDLGQLTMLDPACGSGRFLVAGLQHWVYLAHTLRGIASLDEQVPVPRWAQSGGQRPIPDKDIGSDTLGLYRHLLTHGVYGVDIWPPAVELARLQLFLQGVEQTVQAQELSGLPDLTLTILQGNGLIGLVQVEPERFDQVSPRGRRKTQSESTETAKPLQGNLLQPLLAHTYQGALAERQVRLEHYRSQTQLLAESGSVPDYAQAEFWRDRIQDLNQIAQHKLTQLLWNECSQQLGIRVQYQDAAGKRQSRLLELADVEALAPFHWGFYFHHLLQDRGGFDMILSHLPMGAVQPRETEFLERYQDLLAQKNVAASTFLHKRKHILEIDPDLSRAWCQYRSRFSLPNQYFRRSGQYPHAAQSSRTPSQSRLYWSRLFLERTLQLLRPGGRCGLVLDPFWDQANSASLRHWLQGATRVETVLDLANFAGLWPDRPARTTLCLLWLQAQGTTETNPYRAYRRASQSLTLSALGNTLQGLIDLGP